MRSDRQWDTSLGSERVELSPRQRAILSAVVDLYVQTGEPVASQSVAAMCGVSSATVRNAMADLADAGLLEQPHTSAGRIPTGRAFRLHVEDIVRSGSGLPDTSRRQIESYLVGIAGPEAFLERTSQVLATLSSGVGLAMATLQAGDLLEHVHFQRLSLRRVLAVVVTRSGVVRDRVLPLDRDLSSLELETAARYLNEHFRGWTMDRVRAEIADRVEHERSEYQRLLRDAETLWAGAVDGNGAPEQTIFVEGVANLIQAPLTESDRTKLRERLLALEAKERLVSLLNAYLAAPDPRAGNVRVVFDLESQAPEMQGLVLVAAPAMIEGSRRAAIGVIGTQRMPYETAMHAVEYVAQLFAQTQQSGDIR